MADLPSFFYVYQLHMCAGSKAKGLGWKKLYNTEYLSKLEEDCDKYIAFILNSERFRLTV